MKMPPLTVIEASAGTGKTFALVSRLLELIFNGTEPERIVALTFSRLAAGEIFNSFIKRLSEAAEDENRAREESKILGKNLTSKDFAAKLREVISKQHLSLIGTLDSFMMRIVRMIPLELGLEGEVSIMSDYRSPVERMRLLGDMLMRQSDEAKVIFRHAFRLAFANAHVKSFLEEFSNFIRSWHMKYRDVLERDDKFSAWTDESRIWGDNVPSDLSVTLSEIRELSEKLTGYAGMRGADTFIDAVKNFSGTVPDIPVVMRDDPVANKALSLMHSWKIANALKETQGIFLLLSAYEAAYASKVRAKGLVTFDDLPRLLNSLPSGVKLPLEYRMDAQFDHWALDEFQDTSRGQWNALKNLIGEALSPDSGKSVFIVGDRKQSIYEWRGGDVDILGSQVALAQMSGNLLVALDKSYRYLPVISEAVNKVFDSRSIRAMLDMDDAPESAKWECREHRSHKDAEGFVQVIQAQKEKQAKMSDFFQPIKNALEAVRPWERGITTAILVRKNSMGEAIHAYLKANGIDKVVFEGESNISDCPALVLMINLIKLSEYSQDKLAYEHIKCSPIASVLYREKFPEPAELSAMLLEDFTRKGMVRKFREIREVIKEIPNAWNDFTEARFADFINCAVEFESMREATMRLSDFAEFVANKKRRDYAEDGMIRIMTMHQSKGLGFNWVIVPFYEHDELVGSKSQHVGPLEQMEPNWILNNPGIKTAMTDPVLAKAERVREQVQIYNSLCLNYVAMTRAMNALTIILHPQNKTQKKKAGDAGFPKRFSDIVRMVELETKGNPRWYQAFEEKEPGFSNASSEKCDAIKRKMRSAIKKSRPSESFYSGLKADALFSDNFGKSAERGNKAHKAYSKIEWIEASQAKNSFERALVKPQERATLWREKAYEIFVDGVWETGQFDRVVFIGEGDERRAIIYDFKTNVQRLGESEREFLLRMRETYATQMSKYKKALSALTGIPLERIETKLLLEALLVEVDI